MSRKFKKITIILMIVSLLVTAWVFGATNQETKSVEEIYFEKFQQPIYDLLYYIDTIYYEQDKIDYDKILDSTLAGVIKGLNDPFAWYFDAQQTQENQIDEQGEYGGLGITVRWDQEMEAIVIVSPMSGTPADKAGLQANDYIITVDGTPVSDMGYMESVNNMRGKPGEPIILEIFREGWEEPKEVKLVRALIETKTVKYTTINQEEKIGYIRLTNFAEKSASEMEEALTEMKNEKVNGLIFDLRNNPGGLLSTAIDVSSMFIKKGEIVSLDYYNGQREIISTIPGKYFYFLDNIPITVLVNGASASASEIFTGAMKDKALATIIGTTTYGKAAVQRPVSLGNGGEAWIPMAHYLTPSGNDIHLKGIEPDIIVEMPERKLQDMTEITEEEQEKAKNETTTQASIDLETDAQLMKAVEFIKKELGIIN
jgi:carboxyl-terminal processing protease